MRRMLAILVLGACGSDSGGTSGNDCEVAPVTGQIFDLLNTAEGTHIHVDSLFADGKIWLTYNMIETGTNVADTFMSRVGCDGVPLEGPILVNTEPGNDLDPTLSAYGDNIFIAWAKDDGGDPNLHAAFRNYSLDGTPQEASEVNYDPPYQGQPNSGNIWMMKSSAMDNVHLVGARANPAAQVFRLVYQAFDENGAPSGPAIDTSEPLTESEVNPAVGLTANQTPYVAWEILQEQVKIGRVENGSITNVQTNTSVTEAQKPRFSKPTGDSGLFLTYFAYNGSEYDVYVHDAEQFDNSFSIGNGAIDQQPDVAAFPGGGVVAWHETVQGNVATVNVAQFRYDGTTFEVDQIQTLTNDSLIYGPTITYLQGKKFFVAWTTTTDNDDRRAKGTIVDFDE